MTPKNPKYCSYINYTALFTAVAQRYSLRCLFTPLPTFKDSVACITNQMDLLHLEALKFIKLPWEEDPGVEISDI